MISEPAEFPISTGQVVTLSCDTDRRLFGDKMVTCYSGTYYKFQKVPQCVPTGKII